MKRVIFIFIGIIALGVAGIYLFYQPPTDRFMGPTNINNIDVSDLTIEEAQKKMTDSWNSKGFTFKYNGDSYKVPMDAVTYDLSLGKILTSLTRYEKFRYFFRAGNDFEIEMPPLESEGFLAEIAALPICDNTGKEKTENAYVDLSDFDFKVVKEKIGTEVDPTRIAAIAYSKIPEGTFIADLYDRDIVKLPEITEGSDEIKQRLQYCKDNLSFKLEYEADGETEVITPEMLESMVTYTDDGPQYNDKKITKFVDDLAGKVNEYNQTYGFTTSGGRKINVKAVTFGNILDKDGMIKSVKKALKAQKSDELTLKWSLRKYSGGKGIGNSYIEVSIPAQHVWCYKNGELIEECDCVTGIPGHDTVRGLYVVQYVTGPTTLKGENDDGSTYESPVNCFIPFYAGQGLHGSNGWRSQWGGDIYQYAGSHGCVNCPDAAAKKIADNVTAGYPVVIY